MKVCLIRAGNGLILVSADVRGWNISIIPEVKGQPYMKHRGTMLLLHVDYEPSHASSFTPTWFKRENVWSGASKHSEGWNLINSATHWQKPGLSSIQRYIVEKKEKKRCRHVCEHFRKTDSSFIHRYRHLCPLPCKNGGRQPLHLIRWPTAQCIPGIPHTGYASE